MIIFLLGVTGVLYYFYYNETHQYKISIEKKYSSIDEKKAIDVIETTNTSNLLNIAFDKNWPNVVDQKVVDYFSNEILNFKENNKRVDARLQYEIISKEENTISLEISKTANGVIVQINNNENKQFSSLFLNDYNEDTFSNETSFIINVDGGYIIHQQIRYSIYFFNEEFEIGSSVEQVSILNSQYDICAIFSTFYTWET